ncbi:MAG: molybdopterin-dependent oxidoreductase [Dehalococcoidia bacterium]
MVIESNAARVMPGVQRTGIRPPKFADKFAALDFNDGPLPVISMFEPPMSLATEDVEISVRGDDLVTRLVSWHSIDALPRTRIDAELVCQIFNWYEAVRWEGVRLTDFLDAVDIPASPDGYLVFSSRDGQYFETLSTDEARDPRVLLATHLNGEPLPHRYGGPMRLVVPFLQGYKSVKWLGAIHGYRHDPVGIKRLLGQSKTGRLGQAWLDRLGIAPAAGRPGDPSPSE